VRDLKIQFVNALLFILTVGAVSCAIISFRQQSRFHLPDDGVIWVDRAAQDRNEVVALHVSPGSGGDNAGVRPGDVLLQIAEAPIQKTSDVPQALAKVVVWDKARIYLLRRAGVPVPAHVIIGETVVDRAVYYQYAVGLAYLLIGLFVYYRRVSAPRSVHFYILCLASFIFSCFHYTGKLNAFDQVIYYGNVAAGILAPTIFLHFSLVFPDRPKWLERRGSIAIAYVPLK
jgi:two-component system, NtrC family, sensor kinase